MKCHDCETEEGRLHNFGCDMERCPFCGGQLISCGCMYVRLGYAFNRDKKFSGLPEEVYRDGVTEEENLKWLATITKKGRVPWVDIPQFCVLCGERSPEFFSVPNEEWERYVIPQLQSKILCTDCFQWMANLFPYGWKEAKE